MKNLNQEQTKLARNFIDNIVAKIISGQIVLNEGQEVKALQAEATHLPIRVYNVFFRGEIYGLIPFFKSLAG